MKTEKILELLRDRIVCGEFPPGAKLPNRPELLKEYSVSVSAFQKCINQLIDWGFLESRGMYGMCVTVNPPHLSNFAVLLPLNHLGLHSTVDTFIAVLKKTLEKYMIDHPGVSFSFYYTGSYSLPHLEEWERFAGDVRLGLVAGAISVFAAPPEEFQGRLNGFPVVVLSRRRQDSPHPYPQVEFDLVELFRMQLGKLEAAGCRQVGALLYANASAEKLIEIIKISEKSKCDTPRRNLLGMDSENNRNILSANMIELLFYSASGQFPDGLIVSNENFLPLVFEVFGRLGIVPGKDVKIVSHCNMPSLNHLYSSVDYVCFNVEETLNTVMQLMQQWKSGKLAEKSLDIIIKPQIK